MDETYLEIDVQPLPKWPPDLSAQPENSIIHHMPGALLLTKIDFITWISNNTQGFILDIITYPCHNFIYSCWWGMRE